MIRVVFADDLHTAHNAFFIYRVIKKPAIADRHGFHILVCQKIAHAVPMLALCPARALVVP